MEQDSPQLQAFTHTLAQQIRRHEKRRTVMVLIVALVLLVILFLILHRMQSNDQKLRMELVKQCQARNAILDLQREEYRTLAVEADPEERFVWARILQDLPSDVQCEDYFLGKR